MDSKALYFRILTYVRPYWRIFAVAILTMVALAATEPVLPALMKPMLDGSFVDKDAQVIRWVPIALVTLFVVRGVLSFSSAYAMTYVGQRVVMDLRGEMFAKLLTLPTPFFDDRAKGQLVATVAFNVTQVTTSATSVLTSLVRDSLSIVGLMAVPPEGVEAAPYFALLAKLARDHDLTRLSMGMSGDFTTAIMLGATEVRIGTALFGARS